MQQDPNILDDAREIEQELQAKAAIREDLRRKLADTEQALNADELALEGLPEDVRAERALEGARLRATLETLTNQLEDFDQLMIQAREGLQRMTRMRNNE